MDAYFRERREKGLAEESCHHTYYPMKLLPTDALRKAKHYLAYFDFEIPKHYQLFYGNLSIATRKRWVFKWRPVVDSYSFHKVISDEVPSINVNFDDERGFVGISRTSELPRPKSLDVKMTQEEAIDKAIKIAPMVQQTPFHHRHRVPGFVICGIKQAKLEIVIPNWLLDPERAIWIREKPVEETRLCWVVRLPTRASKEKISKLLPPEIRVFLDAATGECVGADFS